MPRCKLEGDTALGRRAAVVTPKSHSMSDVVGIMTGALKVEEKDQALTSVR